MSIDNTKLQLYSGATPDKVVFSKSSISIPANSSTFVPAVGRYVLPIGIATIDSGASYTPAEIEVHGSGNSYYLEIFNPSASVAATGYIAGLALPGDTGAITPSLDNTDSQLAYVSTTKNMNVKFSGTFHIAAGGTDTRTVVHGLGYIPWVTVAMKANTDELGGSGSNFIEDEEFWNLIQPSYKLDTTNLIFNVAAAAGYSLDVYYYIREN